ncbi:MAG: class I SAM-dependent methyltransferase [Elusimicrobiales bacterium]|nr:class I SAM-dependent methyltransferase [Elusimicrobiales bacterium]
MGTPTTTPPAGTPGAFCPVCLAPGPHRELLTHTDPFGGGVYLLRSCAACGADFSDPMKNPGPEWYAAAAPAWTPSVPSPIPSWRLRELSRLRAAKPGAASLLEVGCSDGAFLLAARAAGFTVSGVDFDAAATARARAAGLEAVTTASFETFAAGAPGKFDVIVFFQTLEHLSAPRAFLAQVASLLNPGGLVFFDIPDAGRPLPSGSGLIDLPPHHLTRWRAVTVRKFLEAGGFEPLALGSAVDRLLLRDAAGSALAAALGRFKRALTRPAAAAAAGPAAPPPPSAVPSAAFRVFDFCYRRLAAPLLAPVFFFWALLLKARGRGFYLCCRAVLRRPAA